MSVEENKRFWGKSFLIFGIGYLVFVIYGSLLPFEFSSISFRNAWLQFSEVDFFDIKIVSRTDWAANILLFIPLAFVWCQILISPKGWQRCFVGSFFLLSSLLLLSSTIEFVQIFIPIRTTSANDILAETIGGALGIIIWCFWGNRFRHWLYQWRGSQKNSNLMSRLLWTYLFFF